MKKLLTILCAMLMILTLAGCGQKQEASAPQEEVVEQPQEELVDPAPTAKDNYESFIAANVDDEVELLVSVQDKESWWENKVTVYAQDDDGGYLLYELNCDENTANAMTPGTLIRVKGYKGEWAGEVEVVDGTVEIIAGGYDGKVYDPVDLTDLIGNNDELEKHMNQKASFKNLTVVDFSQEEGSDGYLNVTDANGTAITFVVRRYLTPAGSDVANAVSELKAGDVVDLTTFVYWYEGPQARIIEVTKH